MPALLSKLFLFYLKKKLCTEYNALIQMYGEKSEECDELKLDLQDVKDMYKLQVRIFFREFFFRLNKASEV